MARVGVLALQGDFAAHASALDQLGANVREVRRVSQLEGLDGLVLPGGESSALLRLMEGEPWFERLRLLHDAGGALFGTCAGAILLSRTVENHPVRSLALIDVTAVRNAYGTQVDSFVATADAGAAPGLEGLRCVFIRAPRLRDPGPGVEVLVRVDGEPVLLRQGNVFAATFHPELTDDARVHALLLEGARGRDPGATAGIGR